MKAAILALALSLASSAFSQKADTSYRSLSIGDELIKFERQYSTGVSIGLVGVATACVGSYRRHDIMSIAGGMVALTGFFLAFNSHTHIKNAGLLMNERGIGLYIPIGK
jgi:hypothetical protein